MPAFVVAALGAMNPMALHVLHSTDLERSHRRTLRLLVRRFLIHVLKDLARGRVLLPDARGIWLAIRRMDGIFSRRPQELKEWYPKFQRELIAAKGAR